MKGRLKYYTQMLKGELYPTVEFILDGADETLEYAGIFARGKRISIVAGELFPGFYNDPRFLENITESADGAEVNVLFGPALYVDSGKE